MRYSVPATLALCAIFLVPACSDEPTGGGGGNSPACSGDSDPACDDGNPCTADSCDPSEGCLNTVLADGTTCDDGLSCSTGETCIAGSCTPPTGQCVCTVASDCDASGGLPECRRVQCIEAQCQLTADPAQDGQPCTHSDLCLVSTTCDTGTCGGGTAVDCSTQGSVCDPYTCNPANGNCEASGLGDGTSCDDGDDCTHTDTCASGVCDGTPYSCDDSLSCTVDSCDGAGNCSNSPDAGSCSINGACYADTAINPSNPCEFCDAGADATAWSNNADACDDGQDCTSDDFCSGGTCAGTAYSCSDGIACTSDVCDGSGGCSNQLTAGSCLINGTCYSDGVPRPGNACEVCDATAPQVWTPEPNGTTCNDGLACTSNDACDGGGTCTGDLSGCPVLSCEVPICDAGGGCDVQLRPGFCRIAGACYTDTAINPSNPCEFCDAGADATGWSNNANACDDGQDCTQDDFCFGGTCTGTPYSCSDGRACTSDVCDGSGGCSNPVAAGSCLINGTCYSDGAARPGNACEVCDAAAPQVWTPEPNGTSCNDGLACTSNDACDGGGTCTGDLSGCAALSCEDPTCNAGGGCDVELKAGFCRIAGVCYADGTPNPTNDCEECDAGSDPLAWSPTTGGCDDGNDCTHSDICSAGSCGGTPYTCDDGRACTDDTCDGTGSCDFTILAGSCLIAGSCYSDGEDDPSNECRECYVLTSQTTFTPLTDGAGCSDDGLSCTTDTCQTGSCAHAFDAAAGECLIAGSCYTDSASNPTNACQYCAAPSTSWSNQASGTPCTDDGNDCTIDECATGGVCTHGAVPDYSTCDDGSSSTSGDWCSTGICSGFARALHNGGTGDEYVDADAAVGTGVNAWWIKSATNADVDHFDGSTSILRTDVTAPSYDVRYFDVGPSDAVGDLEGYVPYDSTTSDWTSTIDPYSQFRALPTVDFSAVIRSGGIGGITLHAAGWSSSTTTAAVRHCYRPVLCFPMPCTPSWSCVDQLVNGGNRYVDCAGGGVVDGDHYFACNYYAASTDPWPGYVDLLAYDSVNAWWQQIGYVNLGAGNSALRANTMSASDPYVVVAGSAGLVRVFELSGGAVVGSSTITLSGFGFQSSVDFRDSTVWDGRVWVVGRYTELLVPFGWRTSMVVAHAAVSDPLRSSSSWQIHTFDAYSEFACAPPACANRTADFSVQGVAGNGSDLYIFGSWFSGDSTIDPEDRAVWHWPKP